MRTVDLFCGCGGMSLGFQNAGHDVVAAYDNWPPAVQIYKLNFAHEIYEMDLSEDGATEHVKARNPEMIIGGPPCQDFSHAGKRVEADRATLTDSFAHIVAAVRPKIFVMENVDRARRSEAYARARKTFKDAGYGLTEVVLNACLCGVPQARKRFICFGMRGKEDGFALAEFGGRLAKKPLTLREYFGDEISFEHYYLHPRNYSRRGVFSIDEPAPTMRGVNRPVPKGYRGHRNDPSPVSPDLHVLTTLERAWIQTFPRDFKWTGSKTNVEQMIGNAVPVNLAKYVAGVVRTFAEEGTK